MSSVRRVIAADIRGPHSSDVATFRATQVIRRPPADVFDAIIHVERFPEWNPARNPRARRLSAGPVGPGSEFELHIKGFGAVRQTLEEFDDGRQVRIVPHIRQLSGGHLFRLTDLGDGRTRVDHELEMRPKGIFKLLMPIMWMTGKQNLAETMRALERHLER